VSQQEKKQENKSSLVERKIPKGKILTGRVGRGRDSNFKDVGGGARKKKRKEKKKA